MSFLFCELPFHTLWKVSVLCCLFLIAYRISWCTLQIRGGTPPLWPNFSMWWNVPGIDTLCLLFILSSEWFNALVRKEVSKHTLCHAFWVSLFMDFHGEKECRTHAQTCSAPCSKHLVLVGEACIYPAVPGPGR